jgi:pyruvate,orthophosphate dikinase
VKLTPEGRAAHAKWARSEPGSEAATVVEAAYAAFQPLNQRLLKVCHDWQIARGGIPNDHSDPAYDDRVIDRLHGVHSGARRILAELIPLIPRFEGYETRFDDALAQLASGKREWFASPAGDSYHTVWMQFHEDLLLAAGRSRADEATQ